MSRDNEFRAKSKRVHKMSRQGLVEIDKVTGEEKLVNRQESDQPIRPEQLPDDAKQHRQKTRRSMLRDHPAEHEETEHGGAEHEEAADWSVEDIFEQPRTVQAKTDAKARGRKSSRRRFDAEQRRNAEADSEAPESTYETIHNDYEVTEMPFENTPNEAASPEVDRDSRDRRKRKRKRPKIQSEAQPEGDAETRHKQRNTQHSQRFSSHTEQPSDHLHNEDETGDAHHDESKRSSDVERSSDGKAARKKKASRKQRKSNKREQASSKLQFTEDETSPERGSETERDTRKLDKAKKKAGKSEKKLEKSEQKLPAKKRLRFDREFDLDTGKPKRHLHVEPEVKTQRQHLKGPLITRPPRALASKALDEVHGKISEVENENVGVEAAHTGEKFTENRVRSAYRSHKLHPYKHHERLQRKTAKWNARSAYQQALLDNRQLSDNAITRFKQKRYIKKKYAKEARKAQRASKRAYESKNAIVRTAQRVTNFVRRHPVMIKFVAIFLFLVLIVSSTISTCSNMGKGTLGAVIGSSYLATDQDIDDAELFYTEWEADLYLRAINAEAEHPGYDEYVYQIDEMGHNPFELMGFLTAMYQDFTYAEIQGVLREIFEQQYQLEFVPATETRYRSVTYSDEHGGTYTRQEAYEWRILNVILTTNSFSEIVAARMDADDRELFDVLMSTKGNRQYLYNIFEFNWLPYVAEFYGYRVSDGAKAFHNGVDIVAPVGSNILAGFDGALTSNGGTVVLEGEDGVVARYVGCSGAVASGEVKRGDVIAKVGTGGSCWGLHLEVIKDGRQLNPIYFAETGDDGNGNVPPGQPQGPDIPPNPNSPLGDGSYAALIAEAEKYLGYPYVWGGSNPSQSFDCSGYVCWVLNKSGVKNVGRTTAQGIYGYCTPVSRAEARPGDIIFFQGTYKLGDGRIITHVGIFVGNGMMIHCAGNGVEYHTINSPYWKSHYYAIGRLK